MISVVVIIKTLVVFGISCRLAEKRRPRLAWFVFSCLQQSDGIFAMRATVGPIHDNVAHVFDAVITNIRTRGGSCWSWSKDHPEDTCHTYCPQHGDDAIPPSRSRRSRTWSNTTVNQGAVFPFIDFSREHLVSSSL